MKAVLLLIWAVWFGVVTLTNLGDGLKQLGMLPPGFSFASGNFAFMQTVTAVHRTPAFLVALMFVGVIVWEGVATVLFFRAFAKLRAANTDAKAAATLAFTVSAAFWGAMMISSELFISYDVEATHLRLLIASLVSFLVITHTLEPEEHAGRAAQ